LLALDIAIVTLGIMLPFDIEALEVGIEQVRVGIEDA